MASVVLHMVKIRSFRNIICTYIPQIVILCIDFEYVCLLKQNLREETNQMTSHEREQNQGNQIAIQVGQAEPIKTNSY